MEKKVTMTFTEDELDDLAYLVATANETLEENEVGHEDYEALQERLKEENEKLQEDSEEDEEDEVKTAVYFTEEELKDLLNCVKHKLSYNTHPDYHDLKHKLKEEVDNFPMNLVTERSATIRDIVEAHLNPLPRHKENTTWRCKCTIKPELLENDISLDSKIGKKCSVWCTKYDDEKGWVSNTEKCYIFKGVYNGNYVVEMVPGEYCFVKSNIFYIPMADSMIKFNKEDL